MSCFEVAGQNKLTKQEIIEKWSVGRENGQKDDSVSFSWDNHLEKRLGDLTDSLESIGVNDLIVYVQSLPGYLSTYSCVKYIYPEYAYLLWQGQGKTHIRKIVGKCESVAFVSSDSIFTFWSANEGIIRAEKLMPVILGAEKLKDGNIKYSVNAINHEPQYLLFLKSPSGIMQIRFDENSITNKEGLFYEDNLKSKSVELWRRIEKTVKAESTL